MGVQGSRYSASSAESVPNYQADLAHHRQDDLSLGSTVTESQGPNFSQALDPVLQDREAFKNSLLKHNLTSISSLQTVSTYKLLLFFSSVKRDVFKTIKLPLMLSM